jgi:predicted permease
LNPGNLPRIGENGSAIALDWRLALFTILVSVFTGIVFGLIPALEASRTDLSVALKESAGRSGSGFRQNKTRSLLVVSEMALALVLLIGAALLIRTFAALRAVDPGFDRHNILTLRMTLTGSRFEKTAGVSQLIRSAVERVEALPSVTAAAASYTLPLEGGFGVPFNIVGRTPASGRWDGRGWICASPHYFDVFKIPIRQGRAFGDQDDAAGARVAIINESFARQFFPNSNPIGERVILGKGYGPEFEEPERQIIGVSGDVRDSGLNRNPAAMVYVPMAQVTDGLTALANRAARVCWIVRTRMDPRSLRSPIAKELEQASGGLPVAHVRTMEEIASETTAGTDFNMTLLTVFGCSALVLAVIGIYGLMAYSVGQRTREIAIRLAIGAESRHVRNMVVMEGMRLALIGVMIGAVAAFGLTRLIAGFLFGVNAWDPLVFVVVPVLLASAAFAAIWLPARRAAATDPVEALRQS